MLFRLLSRSEHRVHAARGQKNSRPPRRGFGLRFGFGNTRNYKMPIRKYEANGCRSEPIKTEPSVVLNRQPTDVWSERSALLRWRYLEHSRTYTGYLPCRNTFLHAGRSGFRHRMAERIYIRFSPRAVRKLECLTHLCLVSVFLDYSILSGSPHARALVS